MLEESLSGIWVSMNGWFTPAILFLLLNLVIGTIAISSTMGRKEPNKLAREPSFMERLRSFNIYKQRSQDIPPRTTTTTTTTTDTSAEMATTRADEETAVEEIEEVEVNGDTSEVPFYRSVSDMLPELGGVWPEKVPKKMKKSRSAKLALQRVESEEIPMPSSVRAKKTRHFGEEDGSEPDEVDAKADDFINRFKQNLKLERLDSLVRYKDMLNRGK